MCVSAYISTRYACKCKDLLVNTVKTIILLFFFGLARVVDYLGASEPDCSTHSHSCQSEQSYRWLGAALNGGGGGGGDDVCVPLTCVYATQY